MSYSWLLDEAAIIAGASQTETELGAAAFAQNALLEKLPADEQSARRLLRWPESFGDGKPAVFRRAVNEICDAADFSTPFVVHEGYRLDPFQEGAQELESLRKSLGTRLLATPPDAWLRWGSKPSFRKACAQLLGNGSLPPGTSFSIDANGDPAAIAQALGKRAFARVVKFPGMGGSGNVVIGANEAVPPAAIRAKLADLEAEAGPVEIVVERWLPWEFTLCVSFLIAPSVGCAPLAACEQIVDPGEAKLLGSTNEVRLSEADVRGILAFVRPLFEAMARDGVVGVSAVDVIVGSEWGSWGKRLPSGLRVCVVECNPRMNRHNRVGMFVERLARQWRLPSEALSWRIVDLPASTSHPTSASASCCRHDPPTAREPARIVLLSSGRLLQLSVSTRATAPAAQAARSGVSPSGCYNEPTA